MRGIRYAAVRGLGPIRRERVELTAQTFKGLRDDPVGHVQYLSSIWNDVWMPSHRLIDQPRPAPQSQAPICQGTHIAQGEQIQVRLIRADGSSEWVGVTISSIGGFPEDAKRNDNAINWLVLQERLPWAP